MNIGLDARIANYNRTGIGRYARALVRGLAAAESEFSFSIFESWKAKHPIVRLDNIRRRRLFTPAHFRFEKNCLPIELARSDAEILHGLDFFLPPVVGKKIIFSVYDLHFLKAPKSVGKNSYRHYRQLLDFAPEAAHIICCSEATRSDVIELLDVDAQKVSVIYPGGPGPCLVKEDEVQQVLRLHSLEREFLLAVGTIEPRKNFKRLFEAYADVRKRLGSDCPDLVVVGGRGHRTVEIIRSIENLNLGEHIHLLPNVTDVQLQTLYSKARGFLYPSLYEGFGFPILEAFQAKTPVLTSNCSSMPEVASDAAILVSPESVSSIAGGIEQLLTDSRLVSQLMDKGLKRAAEFSWEKSVHQTLEIYRRVINEVEQVHEDTDSYNELSVPA